MKDIFINMHKKFVCGVLGNIRRHDKINEVLKDMEHNKSTVQKERNGKAWTTALQTRALNVPFSSASTTTIMRITAPSTASRWVHTRKTRL